MMNNRDKEKGGIIPIGAKGVGSIAITYCMRCEKPLNGAVMARGNEKVYCSECVTYLDIRYLNA